MRKGLFYFVLTCILFQTGCDSSSRAKDQPLPPDTWFTLHVNDVPIQVQIALSMPEKQRGLMFREQLGQDSGMLFPYESPQRVAFWMKNTPLPLDLGLFDSDGVLKEIHRLMPHDTTSVRSQSGEIQYALEMHQGWYARNNLYPGSRLDLRQVAEAVRKRGYRPEQYGLSSR